MDAHAKNKTQRIRVMSRHYRTRIFGCAAAAPAPRTIRFQQQIFFAHYFAGIIIRSSVIHCPQRQSTNSVENKYQNSAALAPFLRVLSPYRFYTSSQPPAYRFAIPAWA